MDNNEKIVEKIKNLIKEIGKEFKEKNLNSKYNLKINDFKQNKNGIRKSIYFNFNDILWDLFSTDSEYQSDFYIDKLEKIADEFGYECEFQNRNEILIYKWEDGNPDFKEEKEDLIQKDNFEKAMQSAVIESLKTIKKEDGGSCNLDSVKLFNIQFDPIKITEKLGFKIYEKFDQNKKYFSIYPIKTFQGYNNTLQCEAIANTLQNYGFTAYVNYVLD